MSTRHEKIDEIKSKLDEWNKEVEKLEEKAKGASDKAEADLQKQIAELRSYRDQAMVQLRELEEQSDDMWKTARDRAEAAWTNLSEKFRQVLSGSRGGPGS